MQDLGKSLEGVQARMQSAAQTVSICGDAIDQRQQAAQNLLERFKNLGNMVRDITTVVSQFWNPDDEHFGPEQRAVLVERLPNI